jgi:hypothetical protein
VKFTELQNEFNKINEKDAAAITSNDKAKKIIGGGKELVLSKEQYNVIVEKIKSIRNSFTLTK